MVYHWIVFCLSVCFVLFCKGGWPHEPPVSRTSGLSLFWPIAGMDLWWFLSPLLPMQALQLKPRMVLPFWPDLVMQAPPLHLDSQSSFSQSYHIINFFVLIYLDLSFLTSSKICFLESVKKFFCCCFFARSAETAYFSSPRKSVFCCAKIHKYLGKIKARVITVANI